MGAQLLPFVSLDAATATGPGAEKDLEGSYGTHFMMTASTGDPDYQVDFEGSHDGVTWLSLGAANQPGSTIVQLVNTPLRFVRANLSSLSGGTSPTVTATIGSL